MAARYQCDPTRSVWGYTRGNRRGPEWLGSPAYSLIRRAREGEINPVMRRRLEVGPEQRDFPVLDEFFAEGATDYFAQGFRIRAW